jgi:hypothetical protein
MEATQVIGLLLSVSSRSMTPSRAREPRLETPDSGPPKEGSTSNAIEESGEMRNKGDEGKNGMPKEAKKEKLRKRNKTMNVNG